MRLSYWIAGILIRSISRLLFGLRVSGMEKIPRQGRAIFAANHQSYLDPPILGACLPREVFYLAKAQLFEKPILGFLVKHYNSIPVKRSGQDLEALRAVTRILEQDQGIIVFPEGTRSRTRDFLPATAGVGFLAAQTNTAVYPVYIEGSKVNFKRIIFRSPIKLTVGEPLHISDITSANSLNKRAAYQAFSQQIMDEIAALKSANTLT